MDKLYIAKSNCSVIADKDTEKCKYKGFKLRRTSLRQISLIRVFVCLFVLGLVLVNIYNIQYKTCRRFSCLLNQNYWHLMKKKIIHRNKKKCYRTCMYMCLSLKRNINHSF